MKLFVDEDVGRGLALARSARGGPDVDVDYVDDDRTIKRATPDADWIPYAAKHSYLVLSRNRGMLRVPTECDLLTDHKVGIVFLPRNVSASGLEWLVLRKLDWFRKIWVHETRPFAFRLQRDGKTVRARIIPSSARSGSRQHIGK